MVFKLDLRVAPSAVVRVLTGVISLICAVPFIGFGQSTLNFGYVIGPDEMLRVGVAIVNPQASSAATTFTLYSSAGEPLRVVTLMIPAGGQLSKLAGELFPTGAGGWIQAASLTTGLRGFWFAGDFSTFGDGGEAGVAASEAILPLITDKTEISILNPGSEYAAILIKLYATTGQELDEPAVLVLPPKGSARGRVTTLFSPLDWPSVTHAKIISGTPVVSSAAIMNFQAAPSLTVLNGVSTVVPVTNFVFPHVVHGILGANNYTTIIGLTNPTTRTQTATLTFYPEDGSDPITVQRPLPGNGGIRSRSSTLFQFTTGFHSGWVRVTAPLGAVGFAVNADVQQGSVAGITGIGQSRSAFMFGHIADLFPWWTGVTLVNSGQSSATVEVFAIAPDGTLIGGADNNATARFVIPPGGKTSRSLSEMIPQTQSRPADGGFIFVRSSQPLYGLSLFFTRDRRVLFIVPALDLADGVTFVPPSRQQ